jgi:hypothetical protein
MSLLGKKFNGAVGMSMVAPDGDGTLRVKMVY